MAEAAWRVVCGGSAGEVRDMEVMAMVNVMTVDQWISAGGYVALFLILLVCGIGLPMPEDIPMLLAGAAAAHGKMDLATAMMVGWTAIMGGDLILLHLARRFGHGVTKLPLVGRHINEKRLAKIEALFARYGIWVVAVGRLFAGVRSVMVVSAGAVKYSRVKFIIANGLAAFLSAGLFLMLGYWLGNNMARLLEEVDKVKHIIFLCLGVLVLIGLCWLLWTRSGTARTLKQIAPPEVAKEVVSDDANG